MAEKLELTRPDGQKAPAFLYRAEGKRPGVVLFHEWWGVVPHIEDVAGRLAKAGFHVVMPDLFRGKKTRDASEAERLMSSLDMGSAMKDAQAAVDWLRKDPQGNGKVAVMGFCMGGLLSLLAGANTSPDAVVCFYGIPDDKAQLSKIRAPVLGHFGKRDKWITPAKVKALDEALTKAGAPHELISYDADHAFFNDTRPEVHSKENAQKAWDRTMAFLKEKLG